MMKSAILAVCATLAIGAGATAANAGHGGNAQGCSSSYCSQSFKQHCWTETVPVWKTRDVAEKRVKRVPYEKTWTSCEKQHHTYTVNTSHGVKHIPYSTCRNVERTKTIWKNKHYYVYRTEEYKVDKHVKKCVTLPDCGGSTCAVPGHSGGGGGSHSGGSYGGGHGGGGHKVRGGGSACGGGGGGSYSCGGETWLSN